jgi:hypothetical protein
MFDRVIIEANIAKASDVDFQQLSLTVLDNKKQTVQPVFRPLAWDSSHSETIQTFFIRLPLCVAMKSYTNARFPAGRKATNRRTQHGNEFHLTHLFTINIICCTTVRMLHYGTHHLPRHERGLHLKDCQRSQVTRPSTANTEHC